MGNKSDIMQQYDKKQRLYQNFASEAAHQLQSILSVEGISYNAITYRVKERESLGGKLDRKGDKYTCLEDLTDIAGVRVITYYSGDVDRVADIVEHEFVVDRENIEINAILLNKLVETNQEIISINSEIGAISGLLFIDFKEEKASSYEGSIENLHWLGIHTLNQLYDLIQGNSKYAIEIAREFFAEEEDEENSYIHRSIAFFYLCYAELVTNTKQYDLEAFIDYFQLNHLRSIKETEEEAAQRLYRLREKFQIPE